MLNRADVKKADNVGGCWISISFYLLWLKQALASFDFEIHDVLGVIFHKATFVSREKPGGSQPTWPTACAGAKDVFFKVIKMHYKGENLSKFSNTIS